MNPFRLLLRGRSARILYPLLVLALVSVPCYADLPGALNSLKSSLTNVIFPSLAVCGVAIAAISLFTGNPNAKQHIIYAILGCCFGFGAQIIVNFIQTTIH